MFYKPEPTYGTNMPLDEETQNDAVFNTSGQPLRHGIRPNVVNDRDYNKPDRALYVFSTMGNDLCTMHADNMVTPIRSKSTLNGYHMYGNLAKYLDKNTDIKNGVYIINYYSLYNYEHSNNANNIINYYNNSSNIDYGEEVLNYIKSKINNRPNMETHIKLRIITFIPEDIIRSKEYVYEPKNNIVIMLGNPYNTSHPNQFDFNKSKSNTVTTDVNINIEVIDNDNAEPYYFKVGKSVIRIHPKQNLNSMNKCKVKIERDGIELSNTECELANAESIYGLCKDEDKVRVEGDIHKQIEFTRLELEKDKLIMDYNKLQHEYDKIVAEREYLGSKYRHEQQISSNKVSLSQLDIVKKENDILFANNKHSMDKEMTILKATTDLAVTSTKFNNDMQLAQAKFNMDRKKAETDNVAKIFTSALSLTKMLF